MGKLWNVAVVGATGLVGGQLVECLEERAFPVGKIKCLASDSSTGDVLEFKGKAVMVEELTDESFAGVDIAFFAADDGCSRKFGPAAARAGAVCIDTSGAWRMDPEVPLVVPEVNPRTIVDYARKGIIASPGSSIIQLVVALKPLHDYATIERIVVSTYQSVSDSGSQAITELDRQIKDLLQGKSPEIKVYPYQIAFNCLPQIDTLGPNGYTGEEMAIVNETRKILGAGIRVTATAVRVPVFFGHSAAVNIETGKKVPLAKARELLEKAAGCEVMADPAGSAAYPMPIDAAGQDLVLIGRIREDESIENGLNLWVVADNVRKGAATNAVQIAEILIEKYLR